MKRIIIIGATSGIGREVALLYIRAGWIVGIAGRRGDLLEEIAGIAPDRVRTETLDVTEEEASRKLSSLIEKTGGMDLFLLSSGIGKQNMDLQPEIELDTTITNVTGFTRLVTAAFNYFKKQGRGHLAVISSIAGTKGLGAAPAYSATKSFQNTYIDALAQLARMQHLSITFTDIRPGFVATPLLKDDHFPMLMSPEKVAKHIVFALERKKRVVIIDTRYALLVFFWRLIPRWLWERLPVRNR
ncbi:MAG: SDR family NAD(P)-dependent oxidoreductase [Tannerellaceae bacterium]|nr:SDR family NAD(P)-dependent oxidoreductase [Tannerellaceae bacterium]